MNYYIITILYSQFNAYLSSQPWSFFSVSFFLLRLFFLFYKWLTILIVDRDCCCEGSCFFSVGLLTNSGLAWVVRSVFRFGCGDFVGGKLRIKCFWSSGTVRKVCKDGGKNLSFSRGYHRMDSLLHTHNRNTHTAWFLGTILFCWAKIPSRPAAFIYRGCGRDGG